MSMDLDRYADAMGLVMGLSLAAEHRPGVLRYLEMVARMAPRVMDFPLSPAVESGSTFRPVEPGALPLAEPGAHAGAPR